MNFFACESLVVTSPTGHLVMLSAYSFVQIMRVKAYAQLVGFDNDQHTGDPLGWFMVMMSLATISSSFTLIWFGKATGTQGGGCTTGGTASSGD